MQFCIVMEDMNSAGYKVMEQVVGISVDDAKALNTIAAKSHGKYWKSPVLEEDWLNPGRATGTVRHFLTFWVDSFVADAATLGTPNCFYLTLLDPNRP